MPSVYTIPAGYSFLESLAKGLLTISDRDPFELCQMEVYLPTRRASIEMGRAFMRQGEGRCLLMPKFSHLGDLDDDEPDFLGGDDTLKPLIPPFKRLGLLTHLIEDYTKKSGLPSSPALSLKLAKSLVQLMDQAAIECVPWEGLMNLVPSEFASHWQLTLDFLDIITTHWPHIIEEKGYVEPYIRHHQLVDSLIARWEKIPPTHTIIAAGSTGTMPATARLLQAIANLPKGCVLLPGLDNQMTEDDMNSLSPCHPQYAPTRFLQKMNLIPSQVPIWPGLKGEGNTDRARLFTEALKPVFKGVDVEGALKGVHYIPCASPQDEALTIAVLLRQQLEVPHKRTALITSDLKLAERVRCELKRWGIEIDSSSGESLDMTPPGVFLKLCMDCSARPDDQVALLSLLKHPLYRGGKPVGALRSDIRRFEMRTLRARNQTQIRHCEERQATWQSRDCFASLAMTDGGEIPFSTLLDAHRKMAETLSTDENGTCQLWKGPNGEAVRAFIETLSESASDFPPLTLQNYCSLMSELFRGQSIRSRPQKHPRLAILGPIEARLFYADVMILGGLNEGTWPPEVGMDPWLNRPMRKSMGFPPPERRIGLSAHDFGQAFSSPKVYLTRALKVEGTPTLACRWLERLEVYLKTEALSLPGEPRLSEWVTKLDQPDSIQTGSPPMPRPPQLARPRRLSVTQIETWMRDPYALYARTVLSLSPLDPLNPVVEASDKGTLIHAALDQFFKICPDPHHKDALAILLLIGKTLFEPFEHDGSVRLFWWPRFCHLSEWFIQNERETRLPGTQTFTEVRGKLILNTDGDPFELVAKADRIDLLPNGHLRILDYKTGTPPSDQDVLLGYSPQLPLEGAIALSQGFEGITATEIESLEFWWLKGDAKGGVIRTLPGDPGELARKAQGGLERLIRVFENEETPYPARPLASKGLRYNDYAHLARIQEWGRL